MDTPAEAIIPPVQRLPSEILCEIFRASLPTVNGLSWVPMTTERVPWTLVLVCKRWRDIALGDKGLWSSIALDARPNFDDIPDMRITFPRSCIDRSGQHSLSIRCFDLHSHSLLHNVLEHSDRWELLIIHLEIKAFEQLKQNKSKLSRLREVIIRLPPRMHLGQLDPFSPFEIVPKLRKATVFFFWGWMGPQNKPAWMDAPMPMFHQLTSLTTDCIDILRQCHQLIECKLIVRGDKYRSPAITLAQLQRLTLNDDGSLDFLVLPSLETLEPVGNLTGKTVRSLTVRSGCVIKTLDLRRNLGIQNSNVPRLLANLPDLDQVMIDNTYRRLHTHQDITNLPADWSLDTVCSSEDHVIYRRGSSDERKKG